MNRTGLTLQEEAFCQLVAIGKTAVEAYSEAFGRPTLDDRSRRLYTKRASNLANRVDIAARIVEAKGEQQRRDREMWQQRGNSLAERLFARIEEADGPGGDGLLSKNVLKGIEVLAKMKGLNAPEEHTLKDGGVADNFKPRGLNNVSEADLRQVISEGEVIEAEEIKTKEDKKQ